MVRVKDRQTDGVLRTSDVKLVRAQSSEPFQPAELLSDLMPDDAWTGRRCFIVCGGPSLKGFDFSRLKGELVIATNKSFMDIDAAIHFTMDPRFITWLLTDHLDAGAFTKWQNQAATSVMLRLKPNMSGAGWKFVECTGNDEVSTSIARGLGKTNNTGHGALLLAAGLGCKEIYLLGMDMHGDPKTGLQDWYHGGYPENAAQSAKQAYDQFMIPCIEKTSGDFADRGIRVVNLNRNSALRCFEFGDFDKLPKGPERPLVVGYCTAGPYEAEAEKMRRSVHRFGLECELLTIPPTTWQKATQYKARYLLDVAERHPGRTLLYLDADAEMLRYPAFCDNWQGDFAVPSINWSKYRKDSPLQEMLTGTILFRSTPQVRALLKEWIAANNDNLEMWDQRVLQSLIGRELLNGDLHNGVKIDFLPDEYCSIFDLMAGHEPPIILQNQASRRLKTKSSGNSVGAAQPPEPVVPSDHFVSIVMPTYNQGQYIQDAVESILSQTHRNFELVIVNDGSTDNTGEYLATITDPRVRIISKPNGGAGSALNMGFDVCKGDYETWWASDNVMYPDCLAALVSHLERVPQTDMVYSACDVGARMDGSSAFRRPISDEVGDQSWQPGRVQRGSYYFGVCWMWRKSARLKAGGEWQQDTCEDFDMTIRMENAGCRLQFISNNLGFHRRHTESMSHKLRVTKTGDPLVKSIVEKNRRADLERKPGQANVLVVCLEFDPAGVGWGLRTAINQLTNHKVRHCAFRTTFAAPFTDRTFKSVDEIRDLLDWADVLHFQSHIWTHISGNRCFDFIPENEYCGPSPFEPWLKSKRVFFHMHCGRYQQNPDYWVKECARVGATIVRCDPLCPVDGAVYLPNVVDVPTDCAVDPNAPFAVALYGDQRDTRRNNAQIMDILKWLGIPHKGFADVPRAQAFEERRNYAVALDNLTQGFVGMWTWEGLAMGAACVSRVAPSAEREYARVYGQVPPIMNVQNIDEMAKALRALRDSADLRAEMAERGRRFARECMTPEAIAAQYLNLWGIEK